MNVFLFEFKLQFKNAAIWAFTILAVLWVLMVGIYPAFAASIDDVLRMISGFPPAFAQAFDFDLETMFSLGGFYGFTFTYAGLVAAIMAVSMGVSSFSRESRSKCVDFLLTKPVSREKLFFSKFLSNLALIALTNVLYVVSCFLIFAQDTTGLPTVFWAAISLLLTQLVFFAVGVFYAVFAKKVRSVTGVATAFGFGAFILSALVNILGEEALRFVAPLKYFEPTALLIYGKFEMQYAIMGIVVILVALCLAFARFCKSDVHAV